jgi:V-type H+-transporting ATPase subunit a
MFGDIGHGGAVLAFSIWMLRSDSAKKIIPDIYKIRYLLFMMGMCSFYAGWIYNEFFAMPINVFGSCYESAEIEEYAAKEHGCVYPFGFDPKWFRSSN